MFSPVRLFVLKYVLPPELSVQDITVMRKCDPATFCAIWAVKTTLFEALMLPVR